MNKTLQIILIIGSLIAFALVLRLVSKNKMNIHYAMVWILWGLCMIVISIFPNIIGFLGNLLGIQVASNMVFLIMIFVLYCMTFYSYMKISKHNEDLVNLAYEVAALKKRVEELEKKNEK